MQSFTSIWCHYIWSDIFELITKSPVRIFAAFQHQNICLISNTYVLKHWVFFHRPMLIVHDFFLVFWVNSRTRAYRPIVETKSKTRDQHLACFREKIQNNTFKILTLIRDFRICLVILSKPLSIDVLWKFFLPNWISHQASGLAFFLKSYDH